MKKLLFLFIIAMLLLGMNMTVLAIELVGPKAYSMGGAFTAVVDDATSLYWNPAGLAHSDGVGGEISLGSHAGSLDDLKKISESLLKGTQITSGPVEAIVTAYMGANLKSYSGALVRTEETHFDGVENYYYSQTIGNLAVSYKFPEGFLGRTSLGVNLKLIQGIYTPYDQNYIAQNPLNGQSFAGDLGALVRISDNFSLGACLRNLGPNITLKYSSGSYLEKIVRPQTITANIGAAVKTRTGLTLSTELENNLRTKENIIHAGLEQKLLFLALRVGAYTSLATPEQVTLTAGTGMNIGTLHLDFAVGTKDYFAHDVNGLMSLSLNF